LVYCAVSGPCNGQEPRDRRATASNITDDQIDRNSVDDSYILVADIDKFRPGRAKADVLQDLQWRVGGVETVMFRGHSIMMTSYTFVPDPKDIQRHESFHAIFVDGKFEKFVRWDHETLLPGEKRTKVGECSAWVQRILRSPAVSNDVIREESKSYTGLEKEEPGICYFLARLFGMSERRRAPTLEERNRNALLREQLNAARLDIGMTEQEVEAVLKAKHIETGELSSGSCKIYGSKESFPILNHFENVAVIFRDGKAIYITDVAAGESGRWNAPKGWIEYFRDQDAAADSAADKKD